MTSVIKTLDDAWKAWCDFLRQHGLRPGRLQEQAAATRDAYQAIRLRFQAFSNKHSAAPPDLLHTVLVALAKGTRLVKAALEWEEASVGPKATRSRNLTCRARGEQWRLVMAHGGLETVIKALLSIHSKFKGLNSTDIEVFLGSCTLPAYTPLFAPDPDRKQLARWLETEAPFDEGHAITKFLKLAGDCASVVQSWAVQGQAIATWSKAMQLAAALRHASAHGTLSASKVRQWGLRDALDTLCINIGELTVGALRRLVEAPSHA